MYCFHVISAKRLAACAAIGLGLCLLGGLLLRAEAWVGASAAQRALPIYSVEREDKVCALTFDAAWGNEDTEQLIQILGKYNIKATFFVVGEWVEKYPESVKALADAGHEVMNHSATHPYMTQLSAEQMVQEIQSCNEKIEAITGKAPLLFRPPYGDYNDLVVSTVRSLDMYAVQWDVDSLDWKNPAPAEIVRRVTENAQNGSIILFHNAAENTPAALPDVIEGLQADGFSFLPVSQLIYTDDYTMDHTGRQIPNETHTQSDNMT